MPRKIETTEQSFWMSKGHKELIEKILIEKSITRGQGKRDTSGTWRIKYYEMMDYITNQLLNKKYEDPSNTYINVSQEFTKRIMGIEGGQSSAMMKNLCAYGLLECDGKMHIFDKHKPEIPGKSYGYTIKGFNSLEIERVVAIVPVKTVNMIQTNKEEEMLGKKIKDARYTEVVNKVTIDESGLETILQEVINNKYQKIQDERAYRDFIISLNRNQVVCDTYPISLSRYRSNNPLAVAIVPGHEDQMAGTIATTPKKTRKVLKTWNTPVWFNEPKFIESDNKTIERVMRTVYIINAGKQIAHRPRGKEKSRIYCELTNANRELRKLMRIDGKPLIGMDIRNSQPLIFAARLMASYKGVETSKIDKDALQYVADCENGVFYDDFMKAINLPNTPGMRVEFKKDFFQKVFFSMHVEKSDNILKRLFKTKYPSVWKKIIGEKGGDVNQDYKMFATRLQELEAGIIYDYVNIKLMDEGIYAFNIFDAIYSSNEADFETAKELTLEAFAQYNVVPTINPERYSLDTDSEPINPEVITPKENEVLNELQNDSFEERVQYFIYHFSFNRETAIEMVTEEQKEAIN